LAVVVAGQADSTDGPDCVAFGNRVRSVGIEWGRKTAVPIADQAGHVGILQ